MKKFTLMALVILLGTSCQVYKRSHAGGYTFKMKKTEKKLPKSQREKSQFDQMASFEEMASNDQVKSLVNDNVYLEVGELISPTLEEGEGIENVRSKQLSVENLHADDNTSKTSEVLIEEFIDLFTYLKLIPSSPEGSMSTTSAPMSSNSSGWQSTLGFVLSLVGFIFMFIPYIALIGLMFVIGGLIFSIIGFGTGENRGLAIAGIIISSVALFLLLLAIILLSAFISAI